MARRNEVIGGELGRGGRHNTGSVSLVVAASTTGTVVCSVASQLEEKRNVGVGPGGLIISTQFYSTFLLILVHPLVLG